MRSLLKSLCLPALALTVAAGPVWADEESSAPLAACQLNALTFANVTFGANQAAQAQQKCTDLLALLKVANANACKVVNVNVGGQRRKQARLRVQNQVQGANLVQALQNLAILVQGNNLLADVALGLQLANNGQCAQ